MSYPIIVADPGSTHEGSLEKARELIQYAALAKADCIKFQLFQGPEYTQSGNVALPYGWFPLLRSHGFQCGIDVTASVFDPEALELVMLSEPPVHHVKLAYSMRNRIDWIETLLATRQTCVVSTDLFTLQKYPKHENLIPLLVNRDNHGSVYPTPWLTDFEGMFVPGRFKGFSDHSVGIREAERAVKEGARWIEKHLRPPEACKVPDAAFALVPSEFERMVRVLKSDSVDWA